MAKSQIRILWMMFASFIAIGALWQFYPLTTAQGRLNKIPLQGPGFLGKDVDLSSSEKKFFGGINLIKRIYKLDDGYYLLTVLDGSNNRHIVHDPYYCFKGAGWEINSEKSISTPAGMAELVNISKNGEKREALYWFTDGSTAYTSPMQYWWQTTLRRVTLGKSGPEPILIMIQPLTDKAVDWTTVITKLKPVFQV